MSKILRKKVRQAPLFARVLVALVLMLSSVVALGLGSQSVAQPDQQAKLTVDPAEQRVYRGDEFTVEIRVNDVEELWGYGFTLSFDPAVVSVTDVEDAGLLGAEADIFGPVFGVGEVTFGASYLIPPTDPPSGPAVLAVVTLQADELGTSGLDLLDAELFPGGELEVPEVEGGVVHSALEIEVTPSSAERWVNPGVFTETIMIHGARNLAGFRFDLGFDPAVVQVDEVVLGDFLLEDTERELGFVLPEIDNEAGLLTFEAFSIGEVADDGPDGSGVLATVTFTALAKGDTLLDLEGLQVFDPLGNEENPDDVDGILHVVEQGVQVSPLMQSVNRCDTFMVYIYVADADDLAGFKFQLGWNETLFTVDEIVADEDFLTQNGRTIDFVLEEVDNDTGTLNFEVATLGAPGTGVDGLGRLARITMTAIAAGESPLTLGDETFLYDSAGVEERPTLTDGAVEATKEAIEFEFDLIDSPQVAGQAFDVTITALDEDGLPAVNFSGMVDLSDTTGTLLPTQVEFDGPEATASMTITKAEMDITIAAEAVNPCGEDIDGESNEFDVEPDVENPAAVTIDPDEVTLTAGDCVTFTLTGVDAYGNEFVVTDTDDTTFTVDGGGTLTDNEFCAETVGEWTVTGTYLTVSDEATVTVEADVENPVAVTIDPEAVTLTAGDCQAFTLTAVDAYGNEFVVTDADETTFTVDGGGTLTDNEFCAETVGEWTVTGTYLTVSDEATVTVEADVENPVAVTIDPEAVTLEIGECQLFTLMAEDAYGNEFDVTDEATFTVDGGGTVTDNEFCAETAGEWTVTGTYLGESATAMVTVEEDVFYIFLPIVLNNYAP